MTSLSIAAQLALEYYQNVDKQVNYVSVYIPINNDVAVSNGVVTERVNMGSHIYFFDIFSIQLPSYFTRNGNTYALDNNDREALKQWQLGIIDALIQMWAKRAADFARDGPLRPLEEARNRVSSLSFV